MYSRGVEARIASWMPERDITKSVLLVREYLDSGGELSRTPTQNSDTHGGIHP
jgi:hypothetical protein